MASATLGGITAALVAAAWTDWRQRRIPHWPAPALALGWVFAVVATPAALGALPLTGLACGAGVLGAGGALWAVGWLGAGDVKLAAALGLWLGPADLGLALVDAGLLLLVLAVTSFALGGERPRRDLPVAVALASPSAALLAFRALDVASLASGT